MTKVPPKFGFHCGPGGNPTGIGDYMRTLDAAGIPMVIKSVDHYGPVFEAQEITKKSGVPHVLIFRLSNRPNNGPQFDTPNYAADPETAAVAHWQMTKAALPPEFDKQRVWLEVVNEVDRNLADWLGWFAVHTAVLANADGYKVSLFGWASGEPEPFHWETPGMLAYLRLCAERPEQAAVALHEYSYIVTNIFHQHPLKVGRFKYLFAVCDKHGIKRPTVHITEWGWTLNDVPGPEQAINDMGNVGAMYAPYPNIQGAAVWYLGPGFGDIANKAQKLIKPVTDWILQDKFEVAELNPPIPTLPIIDGWQQFPDIPTPPQGGSMIIESVEYPKALLDGWGDRTVDKVWLRWSHNNGSANVFTDWQEIAIPAGLDLRGIQVRARTLQSVEVECDGGSLPPQQYARVVYVAPPTATAARKAEIAAEAIAGGHTFTSSYDDAGYAPGFLSNKNVLYDIPESQRQEFIDFYKKRYPDVVLEFRGNSSPAPFVL